MFEEGITNFFHFQKGRINTIKDVHNLVILMQNLKTSLKKNKIKTKAKSLCIKYHAGLTKIKTKAKVKSPCIKYHKKSRERKGKGCVFFNVIGFSRKSRNQIINQNALTLTLLANKISVEGFDLWKSFAGKSC